MAKAMTENLTPTEHLIFQYLVETDASQPEIARRLKRGVRAIKYHSSNIFRKTGKPDRIALMLAYWRQRTGIRASALPKAARRAA